MGFAGMSFAQSTNIFVGRVVGQGQFRAAKSLALRLFVCSFAFATLLAGGVYVASPHLPKLLNKDPAVQKAAKPLFQLLAPALFFVTIRAYMRGLLRAFGRPKLVL